MIRRYRESRRTFGRIGRISAVLCVVLAFGFGCAKQKTVYKPPFLATKGDVKRYALIALDHQDSDVRRSAILQISRTRHAGEPVAIDTLALVARTDGSESVRCAAVRALGRQHGNKCINTMIALLRDTGGQTGIRPAGDQVRWESMKALCECADAGAITPPARATVEDLAVQALASDRFRDVQVSAAHLLGHFPTMDAARALITALRHADFAVVYEAERSLLRLTGTTHDHDPLRWSRWLESTTDPFAKGEANQAG